MGLTLGCEVGGEVDAVGDLTGGDSKTDETPTQHHSAPHKTQPLVDTDHTARK